MRQRRTFSKEFKREAVALLEDGTRTYREVAEQLGISYSQLRKWKQKLADEGEDAFRGRGNRTAAEAEVHLLREEVRRLKEENEILKKASAYFAKHLK
jgi:transposase